MSTSCLKLKNSKEQNMFIEFILPSQPYKKSLSNVQLSNLWFFNLQKKDYLQATIFLLKQTKIWRFDKLFMDQVGTDFFA